jgi:DNA repair protein SbcC/Rad50
MIPCRVELTDFLSHRCADGEPVVFDFDGAVLWSVSGDNGAGKSAIFDAITWTLFGEHRGGNQDAKRLISHGADWCSAAFVFAVDGVRYRVERSLRRRGSSKRSAARWDEDAHAWKEISGTTSDRGFVAWRDDLLGLSYKAFTQSVLLLQGNSDRLIRAGSKDRFEILAELVDLSSYRRLEDGARERASQARGRKAALRQDLERLQPVTPDERRAAGAEVERLESERGEREKLRQAQVTVVAGAVEHEKLGQRLAATRSAIAVAERVLAEQDGERDAEAVGRRADALRRALPAIETAVLHRTEHARVEQALAAIGTTAETEAALASCDKTLAEIRAGLDKAREAERDLARRLAELDAAVSRLEQEIAGIRAGAAEAVCSRCGQEVSEDRREAHLAHAEAELAERSVERDGAREAYDRLAATRAAAEEAADAKAMERSRLEATRERSAELEDARDRTRAALAKAVEARGLADWDDPRAAVVREGPAGELAALVDELRAEGAELDEQADRLATVAKAQAKAREELAELRGAAAVLDEQLADVAAEHRVPVETAEEELARRRAAADEIADLVEQAQAQLRDLDRREEALRDKRENLGRAERDERLATRLATLLGRQGIQGQLLAHAARSLEALANDTLRALTGGTLSLEIRPDDVRGRDEITIAARDLAAGGERTDAAFLSGSEKFRVCVAMAAAIGKYAGGRTKIESLIVDEGFGSLDEVGRDDMIDELQRLAGMLERVIVVSHQGEFQDRARFPHGYRLRRTERETEIERYL